jgi:ribosome-associated protein
MSEIIIEVDRYPIRLGQFLKLANLVQDGFEAKAHIVHGEVKVNGVAELRRGRQLNRGDRISYQGITYRCR